jgi:hypothetical protein
LKWNFQCFWPKPTSISDHSHVCCMLPHLIDHPSNIWCKYKPWKLLIMNFSWSSYYFSPLRSKTRFSNTISLCSSLHVMDQASPPCETRRDYNLYILGSLFLIVNENAKVLDLMVARILQI